MGMTLKKRSSDYSPSVDKSLPIAYKVFLPRITYKECDHCEGYHRGYFYRVETYKYARTQWEYYCPDCVEDNIKDKNILHRFKAIFKHYKYWRSLFKGLNYKLTFGKYKGLPLRGTIQAKPSYIEWCLDNYILKLKPPAKKLYKRHIKEYRKARRNWYAALREVENEYGIWVDDGKGNCGFIKDPW